MDGNKFVPKLLQNLLEILDEDEYYDIKIEVGNDPDVKIFRAHMVILNHRSPYLREILSTNKKKNDETLVYIKLPNILPGIFQVILRYIYSGRISLVDRDAPEIIKILIAANELSLLELIPHLQSFLIKHKSNWMEQNFNMVYQLSSKNDSFSTLQNYCTDLMLKKPDKIFQSKDFTSISEESLISLIKNDNLQMKVIQVWEHVLKWGIAQNFEPSLSDPSNFSKDDFNTLKDTLQNCIPLINFHNLVSKEFLDKVFPYKKVLPKELYKELLNVFLNHDYRPSKPQVTTAVTTAATTESTTVPQVNTQVYTTEPQVNTTHTWPQVNNTTYAWPQVNTTHAWPQVNAYAWTQLNAAYVNTIYAQPQVNTTYALPQVNTTLPIYSQIITFKHAELISKWIDRLTITDEIKNSYKFRLILRETQNKFRPKTFHKACKNKLSTLIIIKVKNSNEILGGFNPIEWRPTECYASTTNSFIFSFKSKDNIDDCIISRVKDANKAINNQSGYGPSFGNGDLMIYLSSDSNNYCKKNSYEKTIRETEDKFLIEKYEIFQILL